MTWPPSALPVDGTGDHGDLRAWAEDVEEEVGNLRLLASVAYNPGSQTVYSNATTTTAQLDTTNLSVTFTAPASGQVTVTLEAWADSDTVGNIGVWSLWDNGAGAQVSGSEVTLVRDTGQARSSYTALITVTPSTSYTWRWAQRKTQGAGTVRVIAGGSWGMALIQVRAA